MRRIVTIYSGLIAFALFSAIASLGAGADQLGIEAKIYDEATIRKLTQVIQGMEEPELRAFVRYLAECEYVTPEQPILHFCKVAADTYELELAKDRALDKWMSASQTLLSLPAKMQIADHEGETAEQLADRAVREQSGPSSL